MAVAQNSALTQRFGTVRKGEDASGLLPLLLLYYGFLPWADVLSGALATYYEVAWFAVAYKAGTLFLLMLFVIMGRIRTPYAGVAIVVITLLVLGAGVRQSFGLGGMRDDLLFIARGPILLSGILIVLTSLAPGEVERLARVYFLSTWLATAVSILATNWLGISLTTYDAGYGARGFYQAANEVTLGFVLSWWYIQVRMIKVPWKAAVLFLATCYVIYTLGTKSGFVVIPILGLWYLGRMMGLSRTANLLIFLMVSVIVSLTAGSIFLAVLPYLPAADASAFFINAYGVDTTLTGGRFVDLDEIISSIKSFSLIELIFGIGFNSFWFSIDGNSVESDFIDILGGGGIIFAGWFYGLLLWGYRCSRTVSSSRVNVDTAWAFVFIAVIMYSIFVGHVAFAASPLITVGMFLALAYKEQPIEGRHRSVLV